MRKAIALAFFLSLAAVSCSRENDLGAESAKDASSQRHSDAISKSALPGEDPLSVLDTPDREGAPDANFEGQPTPTQKAPVLEGNDTKDMSGESKVAADEALVERGRAKAKELGYNPVPVYMNENDTISIVEGAIFTERHGRWMLVKGDMLINVGPKPVIAGDHVLQQGEYATADEDGLNKGATNVADFEPATQEDKSQEKPDERRMLYDFHPLTRDRDKCPGDMTVTLGMTEMGLTGYVTGFRLAVEDIDTPATGWLSFELIGIAQHTDVIVLINGREAWKYSGNAKAQAVSTPIQLTDEERKEKTLKLVLRVGDGPFPKGGIQVFRVYEETPLRGGDAGFE